MSIPYPPGEALTCQQIRELDALAIEHVGIPGLVLMENAGRRTAEFIHAALLNPSRSRVLVLAGPGNNGGDGFVIARHLHNGGAGVVIALAAPPQKSRGDAAVNLGICERMGLSLLRAYEPEELAGVQAEAERADVIVDALLGTGSRGSPRGLSADMIRIANAVPNAWRVAVDLPSGLDGDTGAAGQPCFRADATVTMVAPKIGFQAPGAAEYVGRVVVVDIGVPRRLIPGRAGLAE